ncbi:hypothetical protein EON80_30315 [bacterium]|nr:MAG: hypothetical protein EON80_30315 [bacterium]
MGYARIVEGDMEAAGRGGRRAAPVYAPPLDPSIKFAYACRAELNDALEYRKRFIDVDGKQTEYDLWAYANFTFDQDRRALSTDELNWNWLAVVDANDPEDYRAVREIALGAPPADAFSVNGHSISIYPYRAEEGKVPTVSLSGTVRVEAGNYYHSQNGFACVTYNGCNDSKIEFILYKPRSVLRKTDDIILAIVTCGWY